MACSGEGTTASGDGDMAITAIDWGLRRALGPVVAAALVLTACTGNPGAPSSAPETSSQSAPSSSDSSESESATPRVVLGPKEAAAEFLAIVCPTDTALHLVENVSLTAQGWKQVKPKDIQPYTRSAVDAVRLANEKLQRDDWPDDVAELMTDVSKEYLELLAPLDQIDQATSGSQMLEPWKRIRALPRVAEQQVRVTLDLGSVGAKDDGCPPAPKAPKPTSTSGSNSGGSSTPAAPTDYRTRLCTTSAGSLPAVTPGESSDNVKLLQWALTQLGWYRGAIGGNYGDLTYDATYGFQLANGLGRTAPGSVAVNTWSWLQYYLC